MNCDIECVYFIVVLFSNSSEINATTKHVVLQGPVSYWKSIAVQNGLLLVTTVLINFIKPMILFFFRLQLYS